MVRMQISSRSQAQKTGGEAGPADTDTSSSEIFRRALEAYDPDKEAEYLELDTLMRALHEANKKGTPGPVGSRSRG